MSSPRNGTRSRRVSSADRTAIQAELSKINNQIERLVDALTDGTPAAAVNQRLTGLEKRRLALEAELTVGEAPAPRLHPNLAEFYRARVASLSEALMRDNGAEAREQVRSLIDHIILVPEDGYLHTEIQGELAAILALASAGRAKAAVRDTAALAQQIKVVAGARYHLYRTRFVSLRRRRTGPTDGVTSPNCRQIPSALLIAEALLSSS